MIPPNGTSVSAEMNSPIAESPTNDPFCATRGRNSGPAPGTRCWSTAKPSPRQRYKLFFEAESLQAGFFEDAFVHRARTDPPSKPSCEVDFTVPEKSVPGNEDSFSAMPRT